MSARTKESEVTAGISTGTSAGSGHRSAASVSGPHGRAPRSPARIRIWIRAPRRPLLVVAVAMPGLLALLLGLWGIERGGSMWRDESVTYQVAHRSPGELWALLERIDAVHGLYYLLMHGVFAVWDGGGLVALRLPSVIATAIAAVGVAALGTRLAGVRAGVVSGGVFAVLPMVQTYAQEGRSYALVTAVVVWASYALVRAVRGGGRRAWTGYAVLLVLACQLHEFAVFVLPAHALTLWWSRVPAAAVRTWGKAAGAVVVSVLPLAVLSAGQSDQQLGWLTRPGIHEWTRMSVLAVLAFAGTRYLAHGPYGLPRRPGITVTTLALPLTLVPPGALLSVSMLKPVYVDRYVLYSCTGFALLTGAAVVQAWHRTRRWEPAVRAVTVCALVLASLVVLLPWSVSLRTPDSRKDDALAVAEAVREHAVPGDGVLFLPARRREWLLSSPDAYGGVRDLALAESPAASATLQGVELSPADIERRMLASDRIVALTDPPGQPLDPYDREAVKRAVLARHFVVCGHTDVRGARVVRYAKPGRCGPDGAVEAVRRPAGKP